tara:strand:- start:113 stop:895 length:783 start_codon:yes stop_codon:yes gene_type:complete
MSRPTVYDLWSQKGKKKWAQTHIDTDKEAEAAYKAGIEIISCEPDRYFRKVREVAPSAFLSVGLRHGMVSSAQEAIKVGFEILEMGADAVYCSHSIKFIEAMAKEGIPVTAHVGLVPNLATWTSYRAVGKKSREAFEVYQKVKDLENAGAACVEVEVVPIELADYITRNTKMITMGMGCGDVCDTQYLFCNDILGTNVNHYPRHAKKYLDLNKEEEKIQILREQGFRMFVDDIQKGIYPEEKHIIKMDKKEFEDFQNKVK